MNTRIKNICKLKFKKKTVLALILAAVLFFCVDFVTMAYLDSTTSTLDNVIHSSNVTVTFTNDGRGKVMDAATGGSEVESISDVKIGSTVTWSTDATDTKLGSLTIVDPDSNASRTYYAVPTDTTDTQYRYGSFNTIQTQTDPIEITESMTFAALFTPKAFKIIFTSGGNGSIHSDRSSSSEVWSTWIDANWYICQRGTHHADGKLLFSPTTPPDDTGISSTEAYFWAKPYDTSNYKYYTFRGYDLATYNQINIPTSTTVASDVQVTRPMAITAYFMDSTSPINITLNAGANGKIYLSDGSTELTNPAIQVEQGTILRCIKDSPDTGQATIVLDQPTLGDLTYFAKPDSDYKFDNLTGCIPGTLLLPNQNIYANFVNSVTTIDVSLNTDGNGKIYLSDVPTELTDPTIVVEQGTTVTCIEDQPQRGEATIVFNQPTLGDLTYYARPNYGYTFGNLDGYRPGAQLIDDQTLTANFILVPTIDVSLTTDGNGKIYLSDGSTELTDPTIVVEQGTTVTCNKDWPLSGQATIVFNQPTLGDLTYYARPNYGYTFDNLGGYTPGAQLIDKQTLTANFITVPTIDVTLTTDSNGKIYLSDGSTELTDPTIVVEQGTTVTCIKDSPDAGQATIVFNQPILGDLTYYAKPNSGYKFGNLDGYTPGTQLTDDQTLIAEFVPIINVTLTTDSNGKIYLSDGSTELTDPSIVVEQETTVTCIEDQPLSGQATIVFNQPTLGNLTYYAKPNSGYTFGNLDGYTPGTQLIDDQTLTAEFTLVPSGPTLIMSASNGTIWDGPPEDPDRIQITSAVSVESGTQVSWETSWDYENYGLLVVEQPNLGTHTYFADPNDGYYFEQFDFSGTITITTVTSVTAMFYENIEIGPLKDKDGNIVTGEIRWDDGQSFFVPEYLGANISSLGVQQGWYINFYINPTTDRWLLQPKGWDGLTWLGVDPRFSGYTDNYKKELYDYYGIEFRGIVSIPLLPEIWESIFNPPFWTQWQTPRAFELLGTNDEKVSGYCPLELEKITFSKGYLDKSNNPELSDTIENKNSDEETDNNNN